MKLALPLIVAALAPASCRKGDALPTGGATSTIASAPASSPAPITTAAAPGASAAKRADRATDTIMTRIGPLQIAPLHDASVLFRFRGFSIFVDPVGAATLRGLPRAHYVFVTDAGPDHFDPDAIQAIRGADTIVFGPAVVASRSPGSFVVLDGGLRKIDQFTVEALPLNRVVSGSDRGDRRQRAAARANGYVFGFGDKRVYVAGDTACGPAVQALADIDVAFVSPGPRASDAVACLRALHPPIAYAYAGSGFDLAPLRDGVADAGVELRDPTR